MLGDLDRFVATADLQQAAYVQQFVIDGVARATVLIGQFD